MRSSGEEDAAPLLDADSGSDHDLELAELNQDYAKSEHSQALSAPVVPTKPAGNKWNTYTAIAVTLFLTVLGFTINTEATVYFEDVLGWKKPFCTMYITHGSLCLPWVCQLAYSRFRNRDMTYRAWLNEYSEALGDSIRTIDAYATRNPKLDLEGKRSTTVSPWRYLAGTMAVVTAVLTISGCSWFYSLTLTTPADLTAIYNCSTFFAAAFSVPILKEKLGWVSLTAVALSIVGTFVIAYGDTTSAHDETSQIGASRLLGNLIACVGAVAFGLYEVLFKKWACSSQPLPPKASLPLTIAASGLTGVFTFATLWAGLVVLHFTGIEPFVVPGPEVVLWLVISVLAGSISMNLLVILVIWTDPVFGSMANVLAVFVVALADWLVFGLSPSVATYVGGFLILVAFGMLTKDTLSEDKE